MRPVERELLNSEIKTRIPMRDKRKLQQLAKIRHLKTSDLIREAIRDYLKEEAEK
jgi:predicted transcriptional regulator